MTETPEVTNEEVRALAVGIVAGTIFTDRHIEDPRDVISTFMLLAMMNKKQLEKLEKQDIGMIYEYIDKAGPRSINGRPAFFSLRTLTVPDTKRVLEEVRKLQKYKKEGF